MKKCKYTLYVDKNLKILVSYLMIDHSCTKFKYDHFVQTIIFFESLIKNVS